MHYKQLLSKLKQLQPINESIVTTLYTLSEKSLLTAIIFSTLITSFLYSELNLNILIWCGTLVSFLLFRLYSAYLYRKNPQMHTLETWHKKFMTNASKTKKEIEKDEILKVIAYGIENYSNLHFSQTWLIFFVCGHLFGSN